MKATLTDDQIMQWVKAIRQMIYNNDPSRNSYCRAELRRSYENVCAIAKSRGVLDSVDTKHYALIVEK